MGRGLSARLPVGLLPAVVLQLGCTEAAPDEPVPVEAGPPPVRFLDARPPPAAAQLACGVAICEPPAATPLAPVACCGATGACGVTSTFAPRLCATGPVPGTPDVTCPDLPVFEGALLQGCCTSEGQCGALDRFGTLGCIPGVELGREPSECRYDGSATCTSLTEIHCDGAEDCPEGQTCCGRAQGDRYDAFGCFPDCRTIVDGVRGRWLQICHPGQACARPGERCGPSVALPDGFARCSASAAIDGGVEPARLGVRCGEQACAGGEKCCLRPPEQPYCASEFERCACTRHVDAATDARADLDASADHR